MIECAPLLLMSAVAAGPIIITGRSLDDPAADASSDRVVILRSELDRVASRRVEEALQRVAGVQSFRRASSQSAHPTAGGLTMRALGGNAASRALLIVDGVPQADPFGGWVDFPAYALDSISRIVVTRGGGSTRWGAGALAGTVEIDSLGAADNDPQSAAIRLGSRRSFDVGGHILHGSDTAFILASGAFARSDGFVPIVVQDRGPADIAAPLAQSSALLRGAVALAPGLELQASVSGVDDRRQRGLRNSDNRTLGFNQSVRLVGRNLIPFAVTLYAQQRRFKSLFAAADATRTTSRVTLDQYKVPAEGWGGRFELAPTLGPVALRFGVDTRFATGETRELYAFVSGAPTRRRKAGGDSRTTGAFIDSSMRMGAVDLTLSARVDRWHQSDGHVFETLLADRVLRDERIADRSGWRPSGRAGAAWHVNPTTTLRGAAYTGWRLSTLNELYRPFRIAADAVAANPELVPETLAGAEFGINAQLMPGVTIGVTAFAARLRHAVANVVLGRGPGVFPGVGFVAAGGDYLQRRNLEAIDSRGIELELDGRTGEFDANVSASFARARVRSSGVAAVLDGKPPAQTPSVNAIATGGWTGTAGQRFSLSARYVSRQYEDDLAREPLAPALTISGTAHWPIARHWAIEAAVENLFNQRVETGIASDGSIERAEPRTLWIGLSLR